MPKLKLDPSPPLAVTRVPLPSGAKVFWTLRAVYPAPYGTVWVRHWKRKSDAHLDIVTEAGALLQRVHLDLSPSEEPPTVCEALYLEPTRRRGPLLYLRSPFWHYLYAFPDGLSGFLSEDSVPVSQFKTVRFALDSRGHMSFLLNKERRYWSGVSFVSSALSPDISEGTAPRRLPLAQTQEETRFAAAVFDHVYFLRWVTKGKAAILEVLDKSGRRLARHPLHDTFGVSPGWSSLSAVWADERHKRTPAVIVRDSDQVRVLVFRDGLRTLITAQDFNDSSSSIAATTVSFGRDKSGLLTVTESYSERGDENGNGESHETNYRWTGEGFD